MARKRDFYDEVARSVRSSAKKMRDLQKRNDALRAQKDSGQYSVKYIGENINPVLLSEKRDLENLRKAGLQEIQALCDRYTDELQEEDTLKGSELTDDARLLNSGIRLSKRDFESMLRRNKGNKTMEQLILQSAKENKVDLGVMYIGNAPTIATVKAVPFVAETAMKWYNREDMVERFIGEGSEIESSFSDSDE